MKIKLSTVAMSIMLTPALFASSNLTSALHNGTTTGQVRYMYMHVQNAPGLKDYFGSAIGGHLKYQTGSFYNFQAGVAFYTTNKINGNVNDTSIQPNAAGRNSRYVIRMIDSTNPNNKAVNGVGQLYLKYHHFKTVATIGRMVLKTPLLNPEDGWMIPTLFQGVWIKNKSIRGLTLQAGYINSVWVRNTPQWKSVADSLGYGYGMGAVPIAPIPNPNFPGLGKPTPANYNGHLSSSGIFIFGANYSKKKHFNLEVWDDYVQNIYNTALFEGKYNKRFGHARLIAGLQYLDQRAVGNGGNANQNLAFMRHGEISHTYGGIIGAGYRGSLLSLALSTTGKQGRLMMPREWGKPPLFTFQRIETADGEGGTNAWVLRYKQNFKFIGLRGLNTDISYGHHYNQDATNTLLNKYGFPSYSQFDINVFYNFSGALKGLHARYMFARKNAIANTYQNASPNPVINNKIGNNYIFGKNGMIIQEFVLNYNF